MNKENPRNKNWRLIVIEIISFLLIVLFVHTAVSKWIDMAEYTREMNNQALDNKWTPYLVYGLPPIEIVAALLLGFQRTRLAGLWLSAVLMAIFTGYVALVLMNYFPRIPCSCGGIVKGLKWKGHLVFNSFFLASAVTGIYLWRKRNTENLDRKSFSPTPSY